MIMLKIYQMCRKQTIITRIYFFLQTNLVAEEVTEMGLETEVGAEAEGDPTSEEDKEEMISEEDQVRELAIGYMVG